MIHVCCCKAWPVLCTLFLKKWPHILNKVLWTWSGLICHLPCILMKPEGLLCKQNESHSMALVTNLQQYLIHLLHTTLFGHAEGDKVALTKYSKDIDQFCFDLTYMLFSITVEHKGEISKNSSWL